MSVAASAEQNRRARSSVFSASMVEWSTHIDMSECRIRIKETKLNSVYVQI